MTVTSRRAGIALLGLALACGPGGGSRTPPTLTGLTVANSLGTGSEREDCATSAGVRVTDHDGKITFSSSDAAQPGNVTWTCTRAGASSEGPIRCGPSAPASCNCTPTHGYEFTGLASGTYTLEITATNASGASASKAISWEVDETDPAVSLSSPPFPARASFPAVVDISGQDVPAGFSATDAGSSLGVTAVRCLVDGAQLPPAECGVAGSYVLDGALAEGAHTTSVEVTDCAGNSSSASTAFQVDRAAPVQVSAPAFDWPHVTFSLQDGATRVESVACSVDDTAISCGEAALPANPYDGVRGLDSAGLSPGTHQFRLVARDFFGHEATFGPYAFEVPAPAQLDPSFGGTGIVTTPIDSMARAVAIQADGKILVAGGGDGDEAAVVRYEADGDLDTTFGGGDGIATLPPGSATQNGMSIATGLAIDGNGKIVVSGIGSYGGYYRMTAARLESNGTLDTTFGAAGNGHVFFAPLYSSVSTGAQDVAIQGDGKIVLVGELSDRFAVVRLTSSGFLDTDPTTGFGPGHAGYTTTAPQRYASAKSVAIQSDGSIVVAGQSYDASFGNNAATIVRYDATGALDSTFGTAGVTMSTAIGEATDMLLQNGKILVCGEALVGSHFELSMLRFDADGTLDGTFGTAGQVRTPLGSDVSGSAYAMAVTSDRILLAGHASVYPSPTWLAVARYAADGGLDTTFGSPHGYVLTTIGTSPYAYALAIQPSDGRIVAAGGQGTGTGQYIVVRYLP